MEYNYKQPKEIVYGYYPADEYYVVKSEDSSELLVVQVDYFGQEGAILFTVGGTMTDWSDHMLLDSAKAVVDHLNKIKFYPDCSR